MQKGPRRSITSRALRSQRRRPRQLATGSAAALARGQPAARRTPARAACIRMLLRGITYLAGGGALLAAVGVHAARHGGGNR